ncbi:response regulator [uncultured Flavobacterium sp.]|uniref:response regulator n=1 Tax=uncultured Flavobacterium sp. TaxID=165435 RepID=UPI0025F3FA6A|nr:response regulator [uncultured Flavobacterium sp.]
MVKILHVLGIDDHAVVLEGYNSIFGSLKISGKLKFTKAHDCKSGYEAIHKYKNTPFDIAVLDYSIPHFPEQHLYSGEDIALLLRRLMPLCKIVMMTMHNKVDVMGSILEKVKPEGFINKSDCTTTELMEGFKEVLAGDNYFSPTVAEFIARQDREILLEDVDVKIILLLASGIKNKNLNKYIPLSESGIEKRKYRMKRLLDINGGDEELISKAKALGYI